MNATSTCQIVKNRTSDYVILLSKTATELEKIAADYLNKYLLESTGVTLSIKNEPSIVLSKFISIGNTAALKNESFPISFGKDGYSVIESKGNLYLFGQSVNGAIWAVFGFLEKAVNYKFYAKDEVSIDKVDDIDATGYNFSYTPTIPNRTSAFGVCVTDREYATGLKAYTGFGERADGKPFWGTWFRGMSCHNHLIILPLDKYYDKHPEWYNDKKNQLCLTNMEMRDEFFKNLVTYFEKFNEQTHFLLGHEDNWDMCYCENCMARIKEVGTGGLHMEFTNDMARRTEKWRKEHCPDREINVGMFAYVTHTSMAPPVKKENGKIVPISDSVIAEPNVFIMFAPIGAKEHSRPITAPENIYHYRCFEYWNYVCKRFEIWLYYGSFRRAFEFVDGIYIFKENIKALKDFGCEYFFVESRNAIASLVLQKMHLYVLTSLTWDVSKDTDELINEFMNAYYKCAAKPMRKFFDYLMDYYKKVRLRNEKLMGEKFYYGMCEFDTNADGFWSLNAVYDLTLILEEADALVDASGYSDEIKLKLKDRIEIEKLFLVNIQLEYFVRETSIYDEARSINAIPKAKALELVNYFEEKCAYFNVPSVDGDGPLSKTIEKWKREIKWSARHWEERARNHITQLDQMYDDLTL